MAPIKHSTKLIPYSWRECNFLLTPFLYTPSFLGIQLEYKRKAGWTWLCLPLKSHNESIGSKGRTLLAFIIKAVGSIFQKAYLSWLWFFLTFLKLLRKLVLDSTLNYDTALFWHLSNPSFTVILTLDAVVIRTTWSVVKQTTNKWN
jgi:hypothetical protein